MHDFLGQGGSGQVEGVAADPHDLGGVREAGAGGIGDPEGAADDPAVAVVGGDVVRGGAAIGVDLAVDGALQSWLVALDAQQVARFPFPADAGGGVALGVGGAGGDDGIRQACGVQQLPDLCDLVRIVGDAVLGDDHALLVQHRGEQLDLPVRDAAQPFPVDCDRGQQVPWLPGGGQGAQPAAGDHRPGGPRPAPGPGSGSASRSGR
ncbi:MAG TPA: hypothetical protein VMV92_31445 [Streptosporangiaceae bacterium]|nr:hypothetical protein [Streptosporangiaceae bacterium]